MAKIITDFIYRNDAVAKPSWNIVVIEEDGTVHTYTMAQAVEAGWTLPDVLKAINVDTLKEIERLKVTYESKATQ